MSSHLQIQVPKRAKKCSEDEESFTGGCTVYSVLIQDEESDDWQRLDFCKKHAESHKQEWIEKGLTYWKGRTPESFTKNPYQDLPKDERALAFFKEALEAERAGEAFILALYLQRRRRLHFRRDLKRKAGGYPVSVYEFTNGETVIVPRLELEAEEVQRLQAELAEKLNPTDEAPSLDVQEQSRE